MIPVYPNPLPVANEPPQEAARVIDQREDQIIGAAVERINRLRDEINLERQENLFAAPEPAARRALIENRMRRILRAELSEIRDLLRETNLQDGMTNTIAFWAQNFWEALLLNVDDEEIFREFSQLMQELLRDPIFGAPLDEESLRGSDGYTYGKKSHAVWADQVAEIYKRRSPMDPENPTLIDLIPHPVVRHMVCWLKRYNLLQVSEHIEREYNDLIPRQRLARIQRLKDSKVALDRRKAERIALNERELNAEIENILEPLHEVRDLIRNNANEVVAIADEMAENDNQNIQEQRTAIQTIDAEITIIDVRNTQLVQRVNQNSELISETEKEKAKLEIAINKTRKAIKDQRKGWIGGVLKTALVVAACAAATWGIGALVGGGMAISPLSGGAKVTVAVIL